MKILILNYEYPPLGGGAGEMTRSLAEGLALRGCLVTVVSTWYAGQKEHEVMENLQIFRLHSKRKKIYRSNPGEMMSWIVHSKNFLKQHCANSPYDVCVANFALPGGETALMLKKKFGIPYIIVSHGHDIPWFFPKQMLFYHIVSYFRIKTICSGASKLVVLSEFMKKNADRFVGKTKAGDNIILPNACNEKLFGSMQQERNAEFTIVYSCRHVGQKDPLTFLNALKLLALSGIHFRALIAGGGPLTKKMKDFTVKNRLSEYVDFCGWVSRETLARMYAVSHIFVSTSLQEGMSVAILEALASGMYVFVSGVGQNAEIISEGINGEMIECKNPEALFESIRNYYNEKFLFNYQIPGETLDAFRIRYGSEGFCERYLRLLELIAEGENQVGGKIP